MTASMSLMSWNFQPSPLIVALNIQETLVKKKYTSAEGSDIYYYIWADADGTEHAFMPVGTSTTEYEDEDGLQLKLTVSDTTCTLTDDSKTVKTFSKLSSNAGSDIYGGWYLTSITDKNNNAVIFEFNASKNPVKISVKPNNSSTIDFLEIKYNASSVPYMIWNPTTKEAIIFRYSATPTGAIATTQTNYLKQLVYAHGNSHVTESNWLNFYNDSNNTGNITVDGIASYVYNSSGYLTRAKDGLSGYEIRYTYSGGKVTSAREFGGNALGQIVGLSYHSGYTEIRNSGADDIYNNADDLITRYTFDKSGRAVSIYTTDSTKTQIFGATAGEYESEDKIKNNIKTKTAIGGSATNYLLNGGFETIDADGNAAHWVKSSSRISYLSSYDDYGERYGAYFDIEPGRIDTISQYTRLPAETYTVSMSVNTYNCKNVRVYVTAQSLDDASHVYTEQVPINEYYVSGACSCFSMTFDAADINSGGEAFKISVKTVGGSSLPDGEVSISVDNVMLEKGVGNSQYSLVQLGNFDKFSIDSNGTYLANGAYFWISDSGILTRGSSAAPFNYAGYLSGSITEAKYLKQTVYQASAADLSSYDRMGSGFDSSAKTYVISGFAKGTGQVPGPHSAFRLRVDVAYYMGKNQDDVVVPYYFDFQTDSTEWQFVCGNVETLKGRLVHSITIYCEYAYQPSGYAMFDNIAFVRSTDESVVKYEYYGQELDGDLRPANEALDGLLRSKKSGYYTEIYEYNDDRQITRIANSCGDIHDYSYNSNGVDIKSEIYYKSSVEFYPYFAADPDALITKTPQTRTVYSYNRYGQVTVTRTSEVEYNDSGTLAFKSGSKIIYSYNNYEVSAGSKIFGALLQETDSLGRVTRYYYNSDNGRLLASVNVNEGNGTCYSYDAIGNLVSVMPAQYVSDSDYTAVSGAEQVTYDYNERNMLESISTEGATYHFAYDAFGNTDSVAVGSRELASYEYNSRNGKLNTIHYGNGFSVRYVYDKLDNVSEVWYHDIETGFYYVSSRYYDPSVGRWINADGYVSTGQGVLGNNMFAYCGNNPINRVDHTGQFWIEIWEFAKTAVAEIGKAMGVMSPAYAGCGGAAVADGPLPFGDMVAVVGAALLTVGAIGYGIYQAAQAPAASIPKIEEKAEAIPAPPPTVIYRYGGTNPGNLTPKAKDKYTGLSFSTVPMPGAAMTTIEALNATGVVYAVQDGPTHVSVRPVGAPIEAWINAGSSSIWTQAVKSVVIKWDGGY